MRGESPKLLAQRLVDTGKQPLRSRHDCGQISSIRGRRLIEAVSAGKAKHAFGLLFHSARAEPVTIEKHGRAVAVTLAVDTAAVKALPAAGTA